MANHIKSTKRTKREMVIPFEGEEMLVVPKKGGFGQPDMEGYVMATGNRTMGVGTRDTLGLGTTTQATSGTTTTSTAPRTSTGLLSPTRTQTTDMDAPTTGTQTISGGITDAGSLPPSTTIGTSTPRTGSVGGVDINIYGDGSPIPPPTGTTSTPTTFDPSGAGTLGGGLVGSGTNAGDTPVGTQTQPRATTIEQPTALPEIGNNAPSGTTTPPRTITEVAPPIDAQVDTTMQIPVFPDLSTMNCTDLNSEIARLSAVIAVSRFPVDVANAYNNQLATAKTLYTTKCPIRSINDNTLVLTPIGGSVTPPVIGGGGGGGIGGGFGGGGGGMAPEEELLQEEVAPEQGGSRTGILLLLAVVGGLYLLTRR